MFYEARGSHCAVQVRANCCSREHVHLPVQPISTNVSAPLNINRAFLPYMRERKTGVIVWIGSLGGWQ